MGSSPTIWTPPQWSAPAMVSISVQPQTQQQTDAQGNVTTITTAQTTYVFDAVMALDHEQRLEKTKHPVQTGADISSHAYLMPARLVLDVGMSDAMAAYSSGANPNTPPYITPFSGNTSKSVSAYQEMISLQAARVPLTITTRLRTYQNMIITSVAPRETSRTITGLRMRVEFEQIYTAAIAQAPNSASPNDTQTTGLGSVNPQPPSQSTMNQFNINESSTLVTSYNVPGAGDYSSVNTANLQNQ